MKIKWKSVKFCPPLVEKAVVTIANGKVSESMEEEFFVRSRPPPLEENLILQIGQKNPTENVEYGKLGGGCLSKPRYIEVHLKIPKSLYKQGEKVHFHFWSIFI